jgi:hypothetical protein
MYLAGMVADTDTISKAVIQQWAEEAYWYYISEYTIAWTASMSPYGWELASEWIESNQENLATSGWGTYSSLLAITSNGEIEINLMKTLLERVKTTIHDQPNRVRYVMNGFVIALGGQLPELTDLCKEVGDHIGKVQVDMGGTACKVPAIRPYIEKMEDKGRIGKKRKTAFC